MQAGRPCGGKQVAAEINNRVGVVLDSALPRRSSAATEAIYSRPAGC